MSETGRDLVNTWESTVRAGDSDLFGHANNAIYTDYVISATLHAWGIQYAAADWRLRSIKMDFKTPASHGERIGVASWPAGSIDGSICCGHRIVKEQDQEVVAEALTTWDIPAGVSIADWPADTSAQHQRLRSGPRNPNRPEAHVYHRRLVAQPYEADYTGTVNPTWVFRWGWASMFYAAAEAGWPEQRWERAGFVTYQFHRDAELWASLRPGEEVEVRSRLYDVQRVRATWEHTVLRDNEVVAIDRADGAFLNPAGRICPAPDGMMESLVAGHQVT